jgi:hypothetical protein
MFIETEVSYQTISVVSKSYFPNLGTRLDITTRWCRMDQSLLIVNKHPNLPSNRGWNHVPLLAVASMCHASEFIGSHYDSKWRRPLSTLGLV